MRYENITITAIHRDVGQLTHSHLHHQVIRALQHICQFSGDDVTTDERKLAFFNEIRHAFGRSALLLSGGATLGAVCFVKFSFWLIV